MLTDHEAGEASFIVANLRLSGRGAGANKGTVRNFYVVASDPLHAGEVSSAIDRAFANSPNETQTRNPSRRLRQQQLQSIGDLNFAIRSIISAVLVALLFSTATMMMQTIRERTPELAVLKTLGFSDRAVFVMVVGGGAGRLRRGRARRARSGDGRVSLRFQVRPRAVHAVDRRRHWRYRRGFHRPDQRGASGLEGRAASSGRRARGAVALNAPRKTVRRPAAHESVGVPARLGLVLTIVIGVTCAVGVLVSMLAMGVGARREAMGNVRPDRAVMYSSDAQNTDSRAASRRMSPHRFPICRASVAMPTASRSSCFWSERSCRRATRPTARPAFSCLV